MEGRTQVKDFEHFLELIDNKDKEVIVLFALRLKHDGIARHGFQLDDDGNIWNWSLVDDSEEILTIKEFKKTHYYRAIKRGALYLD